jgi:hypothetical protein
MDVPVPLGLPKNTRGQWGGGQSTQQHRPVGTQPLPFGNLLQFSKPWFPYP